MLRWLKGRREAASPRVLTDDPLATITVTSNNNQVYAVSRVNPIFVEEETEEKTEDDYNELTKPGTTNSGSSGYASHRSSSSVGPEEESRPTEEAGPRAIDRGLLVRSKQRISLNTIHEGKVDYPIPRPVWPKGDHRQWFIHSHLEDFFLYYTTLRFDPSLRIHRKAKRPSCASETGGHITSKEILKELSDTIDSAAEGDSVSAEEVLDSVRKKISSKIEEISTVSSKPKSWPSFSPQGSSSSGSSSGFSDLTQSPVSQPCLPVFVEDLPHSGTNSVRNMVYSSLQCRVPALDTSNYYDKVSAVENGKSEVLSKQPETEVEDESYYDYCRYRGMDFTLDALQSERLVKKIKARKKQRCCCRIITSIAGLVLFLISVIVVSMLLTRGERMFGSL